MTLLKNRLFTLLLFVLLIPFGVWAQEKTVSGKVSDTMGDALPGVTVYVKGTNVGSTTDNSGKYSIRIPQNSKILVFSFIGMETQEVEIANQTQINVTLLESVTGLEEVIAIVKE
ncbi:MAG TPA: carboxypeptidase-like regulatory domain-containing protein [Prolixibacteraceae bacterium]|nr:carboxypeptidase-like regulatory domain-containing protein [Prolixibacteraceae bacterium]